MGQVLILTTRCHIFRGDYGIPTSVYDFLKKKNELLIVVITKASGDS
jgi:hypothetical protein